MTRDTKGETTTTTRLWKRIGPAKLAVDYKAQQMVAHINMPNPVGTHKNVHSFTQEFDSLWTQILIES